MAVQPKAKKEAVADFNRADAWLNIYVTSRKGVRKQLGGLPLDKSKPVQEAFMELSAEDLKKAFLSLIEDGRMEFVVNSGAGTELQEDDSFL